MILIREVHDWRASLLRAQARGGDNAFQRSLPFEHHVFHISRYAPSISRAKPGPSVNGEASIRARNSARNFANPVKSDASRTAMPTYSSLDRAINSGIPIVVSKLPPARATAVSPASVTTGTPIHSASQVVVP